MPNIPRSSSLDSLQKTANVADSRHLVERSEALQLPPAASSSGGTAVDILDRSGDPRRQLPIVSQTQQPRLERKGLMPKGAYLLHIQPTTPPRPTAQDMSMAEYVQTVADAAALATPASQTPNDAFDTAMTERRYFEVATQLYSVGYTQSFVEVVQKTLETLQPESLEAALQIVMSCNASLGTEYAYTLGKGRQAPNTTALRDWLLNTTTRTAKSRPVDAGRCQNGLQTAGAAQIVPEGNEPARHPDGKPYFTPSQITNDMIVCRRDNPPKVYRLANMPKSHTGKRACEVDSYRGGKKDASEIRNSKHSKGSRQRRFEGQHIGYLRE